MKPETLKENIKQLSKIFEIPEEKIIKLALNAPNLFHQKPETLNSNITKIAEILNIEKNEVVNLAKINPCIFYLNPETTVKKIKLLEYYKKIKNENDNKLIFSADSTEAYYKKNLAYLVKKSFDYKGVTQNNFAEYITANPDKIYEFELPESEFNEEFIQFTKNYFNNLIGKCNINFIIQNENNQINSKNTEE